MSTVQKMHGKLFGVIITTCMIHPFSGAGKTFTWQNLTSKLLERFRRPVRSFGEKSASCFQGKFAEKINQNKLSHTCTEIWNSEKCLNKDMLRCIIVPLLSCINTQFIKHILKLYAVENQLQWGDIGTLLLKET